ncbi:MAG: ribosomal protein S18-alanine N-acetyltransferase [Clostridia bacterium]|nr:ribosomal protein S18-alanine N-acetyltransferase [Clostridia bacterium]
MQIELMNKSHIDGIVEIENESFAIPWSRASVEKELSNNLAIYVVAAENEKVIGYGGMWHIVNEGHITNIAVHKDYRQKGIGNAIINKLFEIAEEKEMIGLTLEVRKSNIPALELYKKNGFKLEGIRPEYYEDNKEDAYIMWKYFIPESEIIG